MARPRVLAFILAGGRGERLDPLTRERSKPAVPFGGKYRIIDFVLSNFVNSGIYAIYVLVQYKAQSLIEHLRTAWRVGGGLQDQFIIVVPPQMRWSQSWYQGTADAVYQNRNLLGDFDPDIVAIFGADHIYRMDIGQMLEFHQERSADVTVATIPVPAENASNFGIVQVASDGRMIGFEEKPAKAPTIPGDPLRCLASMGNYLFNRETLVDTLEEDAKRTTAHDFGQTIIPELVPQARVFAYKFSDNRVPGVRPYEESSYWRDVGTIWAYWEANMDLLGRAPRLDLANGRWPILTTPHRGPSARIIDGDVSDVLLGEGSWIEGATVHRTIVGRDVRIEEGASLEECLIMDHTTVQAGCRLRRVIVDRYNTLSDGVRIGFDQAEDTTRFHVDSSGIVVVPRGRTRR